MQCVQRIIGPGASERETASLNEVDIVESLAVPSHGIRSRWAETRGEAGGPAAEAGSVSVGAAMVHGMA